MPLLMSINSLGLELSELSNDINLISNPYTSILKIRNTAALFLLGGAVWIGNMLEYG
jgi:hypothetical protein